jgi:hypothetical protein
MASSERFANLPPPHSLIKDVEGGYAKPGTLREFQVGREAVSSSQPPSLIRIKDVRWGPG